MTSTVKICNTALSLIGASARVASISPPDGSVEAGHCATFFDMVRREALELAVPHFALRRADLAELSTNPSDNWAYAYATPSLMLKPLRIIRAVTGLTVFNQDAVSYTPSDRGGAPFDIENDVIYSNEPNAQLIYLADVQDPGRFSPLFVTGMAMLLASYLAGPLIKGLPGARVGANWRQQAEAKLAKAAASAANASTASSDFIPSSIAARA